MATVLANIYPPLIDTFMPAFPYDGAAKVIFSISPYNTLTSIRYIHVSLVDQKTNQAAFAGSANALQGNLPSGTNLLNGIWILPRSNIENILSVNTDSNTFELTIPSSLLKNQDNTTDKVFKMDNYYKLQIRFDTYQGQKESDPAAFDITAVQSDYLTSKRAYFSEWSGVCLLKAIPRINIFVRNFDLTVDSNEYNIAQKTKNKVPQYVPGLIPISVIVQYSDGSIEIDNDSGGGTILSEKKSTETTNNHGEYLKAYQVTITDEQDKIHDDSGLIYVKPGDINKHSFTYLLDTQEWTERGVEYAVNIKIITNNNYEYNNNDGKTFENKLKFQLIDYPYQWERSLPVFHFKTVNRYAYGIDHNDIVTEEDGKIEFTITVSKQQPGYLFVKRASSLDNFKKWTIIKCENHSSEEANKAVECYVCDNTVSSLIQYKYACQWMTLKGGYLSPSIVSEPVIYPKFHDILISRGDRQLAIRYNAQIASLSVQKTRVKIDTLGGRYPKFAENAKMNYKQFNLSGLLTVESDYNRTFINDLEKKYKSSMDMYDEEMNGAYSLRNDTIVEADDPMAQFGTYTGDIQAANNGGKTIQKRKRDAQIGKRMDMTTKSMHDLYPMDNWWWERVFREEALQWLNDGEPKLYRSMTEGNLIVMLDGISITPNAQVGRRFWNFSCTVYEVGDGNDLEMLDALGIYHIENDYSQELLEGIISDVEIEQTPELHQRYRISAEGYWKNHRSNKATGADNSRLQIVDTIIEPEINKRFQSDGGNYLYVPNSVALKDLKISFESLPNWYDLDTGNVVSIPLASEDLNSLTQLDLDAGTEKNGTIETSTIGDNIIDTVFKKNDPKKNYALGYKVLIKFAYSPTAESSTERIIFVNEHGYYQVPSNVVVKEITLFDNEVAVLDYLLVYSLKYDDSNMPDRIEISEKIVGQIGGWYRANTNINNLINKKYEYYDYDKNTNITTVQELQYWNAIGFDMTSYTQLAFKSIDEKNVTDYVVGRTGILNLQTDFPVDFCTILGRRMFRADLSRQPYLDEWEFVLDDSVYDNNDSESQEYGDYWWNLIDEEGNSEDTLVRVRLFYSEDAYITRDENDEIIFYAWDVDSFREVYNDWYSLDNRNFTKSSIKDPKINTVYGVIDENGIFSYKLFYIDHGWYDVKFEDEDKTIMLAKVPVNGLINYRGTLTKKYWLDRVSTT